MSTEPRIRDAVEGDVFAITHLLSELNRDEGIDARADANEIARALFSPTRNVALQALVAEVDGTVVGTVMFYAGYDTLSGSEGYHLADIIITHTHRRVGIGYALYAALAARVLEQKKQWVSLTVLRKNDAARGFYAAIGMTQVDVDFFAMGGRALKTLV